jgi:hypothetical protein
MAIYQPFGMSGGGGTSGLVGGMWQDANITNEYNRDQRLAQDNRLRSASMMSSMFRSLRRNTGGGGGGRGGHGFGKLFEHVKGLPQTALNEADFASLRGGLQSQADATASQQIGNVAARAGGDTSSPLFQLLSSGVRGGASADVGGTMAGVRVDDKRRQFGERMQHAGLLTDITKARAQTNLGQQGIDLQSRQLDLQQLLAMLQQFGFSNA